MTEEQWTPGNKAELMTAIEHEWGLLMDVIVKLDARKRTMTDAEGWSPGDNLAHLTEWMNILMGFYMDLHRAHEVMKVPPEVTQDWDFEARNQFLYERNRGRDFDEVLDEIKRVYAELLIRLERLSFDDLLKPQHPFDPTKRPLLDFVLRGTIHHFVEHRARIEKTVWD